MTYEMLTRGQVERIEKELHQAMKGHALETKEPMLNWYEGRISALLEVVWWFGRSEDDRPYSEWIAPYAAYINAAIERS